MTFFCSLSFVALLWHTMNNIIQKATIFSHFDLSSVRLDNYSFDKMFLFFMLVSTDMLRETLIILCYSDAHYIIYNCKCIKINVSIKFSQKIGQNDENLLCSQAVDFFL